MSMPCWRSNYFIGQFADSYVGNTELEGGHIGTGLSVLSYLFTKISNDPFTHPQIKGLDSEKRLHLLELAQRCRNGAEIAIALSKAKNHKEILQIIHLLLEKLASLKQNESFFVPAGWISLNSNGFLVFVVQKLTEESYSFTVCNRGGTGILYHPSTASDTIETLPKLKYRTSLCLPSVSKQRLLDPSFWCVTFDLFLKESEYHRVEVIYDVLLPWLGVKMEESIVHRNGVVVPEIIERTDENSRWKTPARARTTGYKSAVEAACYYLNTRGWGDELLKVLMLMVRQEILRMAGEELLGIAEKVIESNPENVISSQLSNQVESCKKLGMVPKKNEEDQTSTQKRPEHIIPTLSRVLNIIGEGTLLVHANDDHQLTKDALKDKTIVGLYFGKFSSRHSQKFTSILVNAFKTINGKNDNAFQILFVSLDDSEESFHKNSSGMPWLKVPFENIRARHELLSIFKVKTVPTLILLEEKGNVLSELGVQIVLNDKEGAKFPWRDTATTANNPSDHVEKLPSQLFLDDSDATILDIGFSSFSHACIKEYKKGRLNNEWLLKMNHLVQSLIDLLENMPKSGTVGGLPPRINTQPNLNNSLIEGVGLLLGKDMDTYAGENTEGSSITASNLLQIPDRVTSGSQAMAAIIFCDNVCEEILSRARESSTSQRLALHYEVINLISQLFIKTLPVPCPLDRRETRNCIWAGPCPTKDIQLQCMERIHKLALTYTTVWQAIERPHRNFDSERALVGACMVCIFDVASRVLAMDEPLMLSLLLSEDGGYAISRSVCQDNRPFESLSNVMEFINPHMAETRADVLEYFQSLSRTCANELFTLRMPDKMEIKKYSSTVLFMRKLMERYGYELISRDNPTPPPEMEALMSWMLDDHRSQLLREHPEFGWVRDMACLFKFMVAMDTRESEILQKKVTREYQLPWSLGFDEGSSRRGGGYSYYTMNVRPLAWELLNLRGQDLDTADVQVIAFGTREIVFGDGPISRSPIDLPHILSVPHPTEDDVLHADTLPRYGDTLSRNESELLHSYLTVDYLRIPMVMGFFASQDRVTYLFNTKLQQVLRAVIFECGPYVAEHNRAPITKVPVRHSRRQAEESQRLRMLDARVGEDVNVLGTPQGLLLNELLCSPAATIEPLLEMLAFAMKLSKATVYSPDASFLLYLFLFTIDIEYFLCFAISTKPQDVSISLALQNYRAKIQDILHEKYAPVFMRWCEEAEKKEDTPTACLIHTFRALRFTNLESTQYNTDRIAEILGSLCYVRNWHGFGLGMQRSDMVWEEEEETAGLGPEARLLRFLQAQGINTSRLTTSSLEKYISDGSRPRPLFLRIGRDVIRVPNLVRFSSTDDEAREKLPPADLPESRIFSMLQVHRRAVVTWFENQTKENVDYVLENVMRTALRSPSFQYSGWEYAGSGRYVAARAEIRLDLQTAEILWRNHELKPLPDSMTQFHDFETLFGREALQCGLVMRQEHRHWVHIAGTMYDLIEWDEPGTQDQGVGCPRLPREGIADGNRTVCARCLKDNTHCWVCAQCTVIHCSEPGNGIECSTCGAPKPGSEPVMQHLSRQPKPIDNTKAEFEGETFNRIWDPYAEEPHQVETEQWVINILQPIILTLYPPFPPDKKLSFPLLFGEKELERGQNVCRIMGCDANDKKDATWKEIMVYKYRKLVHVFNLVSHGRRMYRTLIFTSDYRFALHSLPLSCISSSGTVPKEMLGAAGNIKQRRMHEPSLLIRRRSPVLGGEETYLPPRLLQGVVPTAFLESFHLWQGEDLVIRGDPIEAGSHWYNYRVEIRLVDHDSHNNPIGTWGALILRRPIEVATKITAKTLQIWERDDQIKVPVTSGAGDYSPDMLQQLTNLGFSIAACRRALEKSEGNVTAAAQWLFEESNQAEIQACEVSFEGEQKHIDRAANIELLIAAGFSKVASEMALDLHNGDITGAMEYLTDENNQEEILALQALTAEQETLAQTKETKKELPEESLDLQSRKRPREGEADVTMQLSGSGKIEETAEQEACDLRSSLQMSARRTLQELKEENVLPPRSTTGQELMLVNLIDVATENANSGSVLRLALLLSRLEDLSHILVWGKPAYDANQQFLLNGKTMPIELQFIEMPRLGAKFQPQRGSDGVVRLYLVDHAGWFISDSLNQQSHERQPGSEYLHELLLGIENCIILENHSHELQVMLSNHDLFRPVIKGHPFSKNLVYDRGSVGWQHVMETKFYLYTVHTSKTFLLSRTLASSLYLILLRLLSRDYASAFSLCDSCHIDTTFTPEEKWVFDQFAKTRDDAHPDAYACRLKLSLAVMYSDNPLPWELHEQVDGYLAVHSRVSADCIFSPEEELDLLHRCKQGTARIKNRLSHLRTVCAITDKATITGMQPRVGGRPWNKMTNLGLEYLRSHASTINTITYRSPKDLNTSTSTLADHACFELIHADELLMDEESGVNRQLGFYFLYLVLRGQLQLTLLSRDVSKSMGELLLRWFHLKQCRWGRETVEEGEQEAPVSRQLALLACMLSHSYRDWPQAPLDNDTLRQLNRPGGIQLYSVQGRSSAVKAFVDFADLEFQQSLTSPEHLETIIRQQTAVASILSKSDSPSTVFTKDTLAKAGDTRKRGKASDTGCAERNLAANKTATTLSGTSWQDLECFGKYPLSPIGLDSFVVWETGMQSVRSTLPFEVKTHSSAKTAVAKDLLQRIEEDVAGYARAVNEQQIARLRKFSVSEISQYVLSGDLQQLNLALEYLKNLSQVLSSLRMQDSVSIAHQIFILRSQANTVNVDESLAEDEKGRRTLFLMERRSKLRSRIKTDLLSALLLSSTAESDFHEFNPYSPITIQKILSSISVIMLQSARVSLADKALGLVHALQNCMLRLQTSTYPGGQAADSLIKDMSHLANQIADTLVCQRHYMKNLDDVHSFKFDPRFLVFEYIFDLMLRKRQVDMVDSFMQKMSTEGASVQQMIMGAGKTTVVGPLLVLMLANGESLVMQTMPTALLEQSRNILRSRFSVIIPKSVYTLQFDRSCEDSADLVFEIYSKLDSARRNRYVVCAAPETIKSLMLKFVEQLHSLQQADLDAIVPGQSNRANKEAVRLRNLMIARSEMADALVKILDMWKHSVLIMDEVDVLLHPLRSELNFPIGHKLAIDLAGHRWGLPIYLLDALFFAQTKRISASPMDSDLTIENNSHAMAILHTLAAVIEEGYATKRMQRTPHLVLLDPLFYHKRMKMPLAEWCLLWLSRHFIGSVSVSKDIILQYLCGDDIESCRNQIENGLGAESKKLLNLAASWIRQLMPHVISKINRVSYGILSPADIVMVDPRAPQSRFLMAVPFVGKDVPSRSSEFAHPDVLIGLTVLAYRYSGMRMTDLRKVVTQLKQDSSRQVGPFDKRPACKLFSKWVQDSRGIANDALIAELPILPLPLFQPSDRKQMGALFALAKSLPSLIHYYLCQEVFPACMSFNELKVSACGHELGSNILFQKRIGFSGTPSNLLPMELGSCQYEPGSDGKIIHVLTSKEVTSACVKYEWSARSLLRDVATSTPPFHVLIDTGALITGMDNEQVAKYLLKYLPSAMEGVVYLDRQDRQMILLRDSGRSINLAQCGISPDRRFTFYDQVHTTGMDIKQGSNAKAALTIGKDMTFRDYAQGAFRMRAIGQGQTITLFIIAEVQNRIEEDLIAEDGRVLRTGSAEIDVPAWLLINSMRTESLQFIQLSIQELQNVWRNTAVNSLTAEVHVNKFTQKKDGVIRIRRFQSAEKDHSGDVVMQEATNDENTTENINISPEWLRVCIQQFREPICYTVEDHVPLPHKFSDKIDSMIAQTKHLTVGEKSANRINIVSEKVKQVTERQATDQMEMAFAREVVHEHEQEAEQEAEEEAEEEEQKISAFCRDDEEHISWDIEMLSKAPQLQDSSLQGECPFYRFSRFQVREEQPTLPFPNDLLLTDNFFRPTWFGLGDRRLKNVAVMLQWIPEESRNETLCVAICLAEAETLRRVIHTGCKAIPTTFLALRTIDGRLIDSSSGSSEKQEKISWKQALQCLRLFNCEMYYEDSELMILEEALQSASLDRRLNFFVECLRLRRKERNLWFDTPVAKLFTPQSEWHLLRVRAKTKQISEAINVAIKHRKLNPLEHMYALDTDGDNKLSYRELQQALERMSLGFSPGDYYDIIRFIDNLDTGFLSIDQLRGALDIPDDETLQQLLNKKAPAKNTVESKPTSMWQCQNCTFINNVTAITCEMCELGWTGQREVPAGKWECPSCTFFNPNSQFYCEVCSKARPDMKCLRF